ncbi:glucose-dependent insulinotropic receptor-like [Aricia agestis]|uniref:glucose-dependent insulinotropic receptor-like n=1 Tax=Aricia agestis TaxID=91739 RepID=UPI001C20B825|nr:glucose-dependent insulinotropic receptor-like [Aricia agestis]
MELVTNFSDLNPNLEEFQETETELFFSYKYVAYTVGTLIFVSNLTVVISSGLIIRKGQPPKSTYWLLGNMSLADTIIGLSIVFGHLMENTTTQPLCVMQLGLLVSPTMVSILTVGLIAVDRYIYILHGLYYQRWCNTSRVQISIALTWLIGLILGFVPATGWINRELMFSRCYYVTLYPEFIVLLNSLLSIVPLGLVGVLYSIILVRALKNMREIKATNKSLNYNSTSTIRIYRGNTQKNVRSEDKSKRSASLDGNIEDTQSDIIKGLSKSRSRSLDNISSEKNKSASTKSKEHPTKEESNFSIDTIASSAANINNKGLPKPVHKVKGPNKWKAIVIVMLTSGSVICTWMPFFITAIFYVFCQEKLTNPKCLNLQVLLGGPLATVAFFNSILNPLIYAWWHKGFNGTIRRHFKKFYNKCFLKLID